MLRTGAGEPAVANAAGTPCRDGRAAVASVPGSSGVISLAVNGAEARAVCGTAASGDLTPRLSTGSATARVFVNGLEVRLATGHPCTD